MTGVVKVRAARDAEKNLHRPAPKDIMNIKRLLKQLVTTPWSERGRQMRIDQLMESTGEERDVCAAIVYARDAALGREFSDQEAKDADRIAARLESREIILPADKG